RRRHTRCYRDWSSDVCSSDLNFTSEDYAPYKDCGIYVFHIAIGTGGPDAYLETLKFLSGYDSFLARHDAWFARVDTPSRLDGIKIGRASCRERGWTRERTAGV